MLRFWIHNLIIATKKIFRNKPFFLQSKGYYFAVWKSCSTSAFHYFQQTNNFQERPTPVIQKYPTTKKEIFKISKEKQQLLLKIKYNFTTLKAQKQKKFLLKQIIFFFNFNFMDLRCLNRFCSKVFFSSFSNTQGKTQIKRKTMRKQELFIIFEILIFYFVFLGWKIKVQRGKSFK